MSAADRDVVAFIERQRLGYLHGSAVAHIVDASREDDPELKRASLARARSFLDFEGFPEELTAPAMGAPEVERQKEEGGSRKEEGKREKAEGRKRLPESGATEGVPAERPATGNRGAHFFCCGKCGVMKHATAFTRDDVGTCRLCKGETKKL